MNLRNQLPLAEILRFLAVTLVVLSPQAARAQTVVGTVPTSNSSGAVAVNTVTNKIYVAVVNGVIVIDGTTDSTTTVGTNRFSDCCGIVALAVNGVTNNIYVLNQGNVKAFYPGGVTVIDGATNAIVQIDGIPADLMVSASYPQAVAVNPATQDLRGQLSGRDCD